MARSLRDSLVGLLEQDALRDAGIGKDPTQSLQKQIRSDKIHWLDRSSENLSEKTFFDHMDEFVKYLNITCYTGITGYEFHYAFYDQGTFYKRHLDQFRDDDARAFSVIMYLNEDWQQGDGGELVIYHSDKEKIVAPLGGTCVFFKSSELEHEVLIAHKSRMSITGWLRRDPVI